MPGTTVMARSVSPDELVDDVLLLSEGRISPRRVALSPTGETSRSRRQPSEPGLTDWFVVRNHAPPRPRLVPAWLMSEAVCGWIDAASNRRFVPMRSSSGCSDPTTRRPLPRLAAIRRSAGSIPSCKKVSRSTTRADGSTRRTSAESRRSTICDRRCDNRSVPRPDRYYGGSRVVSECRDVLLIAAGERGRGVAPTALAWVCDWAFANGIERAYLPQCIPRTTRPRLPLAAASRARARCAAASGSRAVAPIVSWSLLSNDLQPVASELVVPAGQQGEDLGTVREAGVRVPILEDGELEIS